MKKADLAEFLDSTVKLVLKNSYVYHGQVLQIGESILVLKDKFGVRVTISLDQISNVEATL